MNTRDDPQFVTPSALAAILISSFVTLVAIFLLTDIGVEITVTTAAFILVGTMLFFGGAIMLILRRAKQRL